MGRYCFYIDGFNMYYALQDGYRQYKWLNYRTLCEDVAGPTNPVEKVCYFSAFVKWRQTSYAKHKVYIKALRSVGVEYVQGRFLNKKIRCHLCRKEFLTHEEKQTDVNIAIQLLSDAITDQYDRAVIVSADSDLIPAIQAVHRHFPAKEVGVMFPIGRSSYELKREADFIKKMRQTHLEKCQFPVSFRVGNETLTRPPDWQ